MEIRILAYLIVIFGIINLIRMAIFLIGSDIYGLITVFRRRRRSRYQPMISVIIPAFNEAGTVGRAIQSVLTSSYPGKLLEVVVVDDGSTDNTREVVLRYRKNPANIPVSIISQVNSGKARALNAGIRNHSSGELVMCLDADSFLHPEAFHRLAGYFADHRVAALSANVKIAVKKGLLNLIQKYEYLVCYQMKRAESLFNCEYIVGGIGSTFRRSVLEAVNYYDTDTVTEDIDLTMKILQLGNRRWKVLYGADVITYTEAVLTLPDLIKQRFRWKWGRCQTFFKNVNMFFSPDPKFSFTLSWFYLPFAIFGDMAYFFEPVLLLYIILNSIYWRDPVAIISAWAVISFYLALNILAEDTITLKEKVKLVTFSPLLYILFYILSFAEYVALIKSLVRLGQLKASLENNICGWIHVRRPEAGSGSWQKNIPAIDGSASPA